MKKREWTIPLLSMGPLLASLLCLVMLFLTRIFLSDDIGAGLGIFLLILLSYFIAYILNLIKFLKSRRQVKSSLQKWAWWFYGLTSLLSMGLIVGHWEFLSPLDSWKEPLYYLYLGPTLLIPVFAFLVVNDFSEKLVPIRKVRRIKFLLLALLVLVVSLPLSCKYWQDQKRIARAKEELVQFYRKKGQSYKVEDVSIKGDKVNFYLEDKGVKLPVYGSMSSKNYYQVESVSFINPKQGITGLLSRAAYDGDTKKRLTNFQKVAKSVGYKFQSETDKFSYYNHPCFSMAPINRHEENDLATFPKEIQEEAKRNRQSQDKKKQAFDGYLAIPAKDYFKAGVITTELPSYEIDPQDKYLTKLDASKLDDGCYTIGDHTIQVQDGKIAKKWNEGSGYPINPPQEYLEEGDINEFYLD